jgi:hypothetical protein
MWDLWWDKVALGRFPPSSSVSPAIVVRSTNYSTITLMYHLGKMYNRPMCDRSIGTYTNLGDLQMDLMGVKFHKKKKPGIIAFLVLGCCLVFQAECSVLQTSHFQPQVISNDEYFLF